MNGYINIELGGKPRGLKFGNRALLDIMTKHKVDAGIKFSFDLVVDLIYAALVNNCMLAKKDIDFTIDEVNEWVDDMPLQKLTDVFEAFQGSYSVATGDEKKSKTVGSKKV